MKTTGKRYSTIVMAAPPILHCFIIPGFIWHSPDKSQTYLVEGDNAELRHYLARLARRSRCFSRCLVALTRSIKLFVYAWNRRQLHKKAFPNYHAHLMDFAYP
jgi:hypothetical protein